MNICREIRGCEGRVWNVGQVQCDGKILVHRMTMDITFVFSTQFVGAITNFSLVDSLEWLFRRKLVKRIGGNKVEVESSFSYVWETGSR